MLEIPQCGDSWTPKPTAGNTQNSLGLLLLPSLNINSLPFCSHTVGQFTSDHRQSPWALCPLSFQRLQNCLRPAKLQPQPSLRDSRVVGPWPECLQNCSSSVCNKPKVKTSQILRNFRSPLSRRGIRDRLLLEAKLQLLVYVTYCGSTAIWPTSTLGSREVSQIILDMPEASLAMGICCKHPSLRKRSVSVLFSKEPKQSLWCIHTLPDVFIPSRATEVPVLCLQMPEHKTKCQVGCNTPCPSQFLLWEMESEESNGFQFLQELSLTYAFSSLGWWPILFCCLGNNTFLS